jgi:hypothetical protein
MRSGSYNFEIENGSTYELDLALQNDDSSIINLSTFTVDMQIRNDNNTLVLDCEQFVSIQDLNHIRINIPASATANIADRAGTYQIEIKNGTSEFSVLRGNVEFIGAVIQ